MGHWSHSIGMRRRYLVFLLPPIPRVWGLLCCLCFHLEQSREGEGQDALRMAAIVFASLFQVVFLLTLLLFSLGWGFIRQSLRSKEGWLVSARCWGHSKFVRHLVFLATFENKVSTDPG